MRTGWIFPACGFMLLVESIKILATMARDIKGFVGDALSFVVLMLSLPATLINMLARQDTWLWKVTDKIQRAAGFVDGVIDGSDN